MGSGQSNCENDYPGEYNWGKYTLRNRAVSAQNEAVHKLASNPKTGGPILGSISYDTAIQQCNDGNCNTALTFENVFVTSSYNPTVTGNILANKLGLTYDTVGNKNVPTNAWYVIGNTLNSASVDGWNNGTIGSFSHYAGNGCTFQWWYNERSNNWNGASGQGPLSEQTELNESDMLFFSTDPANIQKFACGFICTTTDNNGTQYYYVPSNSLLFLPSESVPNPVVSNLTDWQGEFDAAVNACTAAETTLNAQYSASNTAVNNYISSTNAGKYQTAIKTNRLNAGLCKPGNGNNCTPYGLDASGNQEYPQSHSLCYYNPNTRDYFNTEPASANTTSPYMGLFQYSKDKLITATQNCNYLTTLIQNDSNDCCTNNQSISGEYVSNCKSSNVSQQFPDLLGCNTEASIDENGNVITGSEFTSCNGKNIKNSPSCLNLTEGFTTSQTPAPSPSSAISPSPAPSPSPNTFTDCSNPLSICSQMKALNTQASNAKSNLTYVLDTISKPSNAPAFANTVTNFSGNSLATIQANINAYDSCLNTILNFSDEKSSSGYSSNNYSIDQVRTYGDNYKTQISNMYNNCNKAMESPQDVIVGINPTTKLNYLQSGGTGCSNYQALYNNTENLCKYVIDNASEWNLGPVDSAKINNIKVDLSNALLGRTFADTTTVLNNLNHRCDYWYNLYQTWVEEEERAAAIPCVPARSVINTFNQETQDVINKWNTEAGSYLATLIARLQKIKDYVVKYNNNDYFNVTVNHVPYNTPQTPFIDITPNNFGITGPFTYDVSIYMPAGPIGPQGIAGINGANGASGAAGPPGPTGSPGIGEIPIQYQSF